MSGLRPATLLKKAPTQVFYCEICEFFKNTYFEEHLRRTASEMRQDLGAHKIRIILTIERTGR